MKWYAAESWLLTVSGLLQAFVQLKLDHDLCGDRGVRPAGRATGL
jgi:hypothetical protein